MSEIDKPPSKSPLADALAKVGTSGEGLSLDVTASKDQKPSASVGGWFAWGKRDQFGAGGAVQVAKDTWSAVAKFLWKP